MTFDERYEHRWLNEIHPGLVEECGYRACIERVAHSKTDEGAPASGPTPQAAAVSPAAPSSLPRRFQLIRHIDVSGVSGTGTVAEGVQFDDGAVALRWKGDHPSTAVWDSIAAILAVHGHDGATELRWLDGGE